MLAAPAAAPEASSPAVWAEGLVKSFRKGAVEVAVLRGVELSLARGETVAVVGASGAGKSTLLHVLGGLERPTAGRVEIAGADLYALGDAQRSTLRNRAVGFVFQFHHLLREFTALENVMMPLLIARRAPEEAARCAQAVLEDVGLGHRLVHRPGELSGGEQQRVAIARALVGAPEVVLADEPTGNLDVPTGRKVFELLLALNAARGTTLLVVTHNPELARAAGRCLAMADGRLVAEDPS